MKYYVYTLSDPITNVIHYVGKTNNIPRRYSAHLNDKSKSYKNSWIKSLLKNNSFPIIEILEEFDDEDDCFYFEIFWINLLKCWNFPLKNLHLGGKGGCTRIMGMENNPNSKVDIKKVLIIKNDLLTTDLTIQQIADKNDCTVGIINHIKYGKTWSKITGFKGVERWVRKNSMINRGNALKLSGVYQKLSKGVIQYSLDGVFIKEFLSISQASVETDTNRTSITQCLKGKIKTANRFIWKLKEPD